MKKITIEYRMTIEKAAQTAIKNGVPNGPGLFKHAKRIQQASRTKQKISASNFLSFKNNLIDMGYEIL